MIDWDDILEGLRDKWWRGFGEDVVFLNLHEWVNVNMFV
jgi:hypothetical protein